MFYPELKWSGFLWNLNKLNDSTNPFVELKYVLVGRLLFEFVFEVNVRPVFVLDYPHIQEVFLLVRPKNDKVPDP